MAFSEAGAVQWLTWLWRKPFTNEDQLNILREIAARDEELERHPNSWEWLIERCFKRRPAGTDPIDNAIRLDNQWKHKEATR